MITFNLDIFVLYLNNVIGLTCFSLSGWDLSPSTVDLCILDVCI